MELDQLNSAADVDAAWREQSASIAAADRKLSPIRAGEIAAARIVHAINIRLRTIEDRIGNQQPISAEEEALYDRVFVDRWNYRAQVIDLSGSRTLLADVEDIELALAL
jgi:hypothetical protein